MIINMTGGGGGSGGTLVVTAPLGVTVTATKDGKTYTRAVNAEGKATFRGLSSGTWMLSIDDATHEPSTPVPVEIKADYTITLKFFSATINATYPAGSTCTCTDGNITLTAPDTSGSYTFTVPNAGTWTVSSTNGTQTDSKSVSITTDGQSTSVTLAYFSATINITYPAASTCVVTDSGGTTVASDSNTASDAKTWTATVTATGTYTVTATSTADASETKSSTVDITTDGQSVSVMLDYTYYLYNSGNLYTSITGGWAYTHFSGYGSTATHSTNNGLYLSIPSNGTGVLATQNKISKGKYTKLNIQVTDFWGSEGSAYETFILFGAFSTNSVVNMVDDAYASKKIESTGTFCVDISSAPSSFYVIVGLRANWQGRENSIRVWLS